MKQPRYFTEDDVGKVFKKGDKVYKIIGYQPNPTLHFEEISTGNQEDHAVNCRNIQEFEECDLDDYLSSL